MNTRHWRLALLCSSMLVGQAACSSDSTHSSGTAATSSPTAESSVPVTSSSDSGPATTEPTASTDASASATSAPASEAPTTQSPPTTEETTTTTERPAPPGQPSASGRDPEGPFCTEIGRLNDGTDDPGDLDGYTYLAAIADRLLAASPPEGLVADLTAFRTTMSGIDDAQANGTPVILGFAPLAAPALIDVEHRLAQGIGDECGIFLSDPSTWPPQTTDSGVPTGDLALSICPGWPNQTNAVFNNRFPYTIDTSGANYWGFRYQITPGGWIELRGQYPNARYFSILPNDQDTNNQHQQTDVHIDPDEGSVNPWRTEETVSGPQYFTVRFRFDAPPAGDPEPNTSYIGLKKDGITPNTSGQMVLRIYGSDEGNAPNSGGVPLPSITIYAPDGSVVSHFDECTPFPDGPPPVDPADVPAFPPLPFPAQHTTPTPEILLSSTYNVPVDLFANPDVQYLNLRMSRRFGDVFVVHAKAFTTPDTREGESPDYSGDDIEGWTVCNYNLAAGIALTCKLDHEIPIDADGYYTLVVSTADFRPTTADDEHGVAWFDWGPYLDNHITWRFFPRDSDVVSAVAADAAAHTATNPYTPVAVYCDTATFDSGGWEACATTAGEH